eukprot:CAMPEP_0198127138 /NCGR_PEP_ID=MMETSP1442-20131203/46523_1 /TAXON_ID= /ORGANISM="Craspedostauros australis, Strain CCMP3328" /LENGTH=94 /DNA_ID=CAMNT_0043787067 /DNA_START=417 /DNA_END=700 /DNA_ORIENTATION=-
MTFHKPSVAATTIMPGSTARVTTSASLTMPFDVANGPSEAAAHAVFVLADGHPPSREVALRQGVVESVVDALLEARNVVLRRVVLRGEVDVAGG